MHFLLEEMTSGTGSAAALGFFFDLDLTTGFEASAGASAEVSRMGSGTTTGSVAIGDTGAGTGGLTTGLTCNYGAFSSSGSQSELS